MSKHAANGQPDANRVPWAALASGHGYLSGRFGVSRRDTQELLATLFRVEVGLGTIPAQEQRLSQALAQPVEAAQTFGSASG